MRLLRRLLIGCTFVVLLGAQGALASAVIPDTESLPWTDQAHNSPLEQVASGIASQFAGRPVRVICNGQYDWDHLRAPDAGGYVSWGAYYLATGTLVSSTSEIELSPLACELLWRYAKADVKPTLCSESITDYVPQSQRYRATVKIRHRVKVKGKWTVRVTSKSVWRTRTVQVLTVMPQAAVPCYGDAPAGIRRSQPDPDYAKYVWAIETLAHESLHVIDGSAGKPALQPSVEEPRAECFAMQNMAQVAVALGGTPEDGASIARFYAERMHPYNTNPIYAQPC
jgi:hypothetical protein